MNCKWHRCNKEFEPTHHLQVHCSKACTKERTAWKVARGAGLVDMLINYDGRALVDARTRLLDEIKKDTPK